MDPDETARMRRIIWIHADRKPRNQYVDPDPYQEGYYDNPPFQPNFFLQSPGIRYPSGYGTPYMKDPNQGIFSSRNSDASIDSGLSTKSRNRRYILAGIISATVLVILGIVGAVLAATLTGSDKAAGPHTVERIVRKGYEGQVTLTTKNWTDTLKDKNSTDYKTTETEFIAKMDAQFSQSELAGQYDKTIVKEFERGSIIVIFIVVFFEVQEILVEDGSPTTTTEAPTDDDLFDTPANNIDFGIDLGIIVAVVSNDPELAAPSVSDVNECGSNPCSNGGTCFNGIGEFTCTCMPGYTGDTCEAVINECDSNPCQNGGICNDKLNGYTCICVAGVQGADCEINIDDCNPNLCQNNGECVDGINEYTCNCMAGYAGNNCETDINECVSDPCLNDGICQDGVNKYACVCKPGFTGENCGTDINECETNPCENGGTCADAVNDYTCTCDAGWTGKNCNININDCENNPCENGGTCTDAVNDYTCTCEAGWTGKSCDTNINDCKVDPCKNGGTCMDAVNDYTCTCDAGWAGKNCDTNINECETNPCENGGTCTDAVNDYTCTCEAGWAGKNCDANIDECAAYPCINGGTCQDGVNQYTCVCIDGYTGENCETDSDDCRANPCQNGGTCNDQVDSYECACDVGWEGVNCEINVDDCADNKCDHGVCVDGINAFSCDCDAGWMGEFCDQDIDECSDTPCENSARCQDFEGGFLCICGPGWAGTVCNMNVNECDLDATLCKHGGTCVDNEGSYTCACSEGWTGPICEIVVTTTSTAGTSPSTSTASPSKSTSEHTTRIYTGITTKAPSPGTTQSPCDSGQYQCFSGNVSCIPYILYCDGNYDCVDYSDELDCPASSSSTKITSTVSPSTRTTTSLRCPDDESPCNDGINCFPNFTLCDGVLNCMDGTDEDFCTTRIRSTTTPTTTKPTTTTENPCTADQHYCDGYCLAAIFVCDDYLDCFDESDERGCDCPEGRCNNGDCYTTNSTCNGINDCPDGTDEKNCPLVCSEDEFMCVREEQCVNSTKLCDGIKDCFDGTDEWYSCPDKTTPVYYALELQVRLMDGDNDTTDQLYGRVEVRQLIDGEPASEYGTICDDSWDEREATVICRSLNASEDWHSFAYGKARFGQGSGPIWFSNFHCEGHEERLEDCTSSSLGRAHCSHHQDAAISCGTDRHTTVSTSSTTTATLSSTTSIPATTTSSQDRNVRLVDGDNCLEGRIEFYYGGEWRTVCDDNFYSYEARAVCKTLGFSSFDTYRVFFGPGTGSSYDLFCSWNHNSIWDCGIEPGYFCTNEEDVSVRCAGDPDILCTIEPGFPSVNCSFNEDICAYNMTKLSGDVSWLWKKASAVGMLDAENIDNGRLMYYENNRGSEMDGVRIESPPSSPSADDMKVEFYYQLHESTYRNLVFSVNEIKEGEEDEERELWNSVYLQREQEYRWLYECVSLKNLEQSSDYTLGFSALRGPNENTITAVDNIILTDGLCPESLLDGACDFDRLRLCGLTVECSTCDRTKWEYKWIWHRGTKNSQISSDGYFMLADSSFGTEGDKAVMSFALPSLGDKTVLSFWFHMFGENGGSLEVEIYDGDSWHSTLVQLSRDYGSQWISQCVPLPYDVDFEADIKIKFKAVRGRNSAADIAIDNVKLDSGECPHPVGCPEGLPMCGWLTTGNDELAWTFIEDDEGGTSYADIIRLVDGPDPNTGSVEIFHDGVWGRICDDSFDENEAKVICRMLGYSTDVVDYTTNSPYGGGYQKIWLDDLGCTGTEESLEDCSHNGWGIENCGFSEYVGVACYGEASVSVSGFEKNYFALKDSGVTSSSWAFISSREFDHEADDYKFMFDYQKAKEGVLQVWYHNVTAKQTHILDKIIDETDLEQYCGDIPTNLDGKISLGITAFKMSSEAVKAAVKDFALMKGSCRESLGKRNYTFENDYRLSGYDVMSLPVEDSCIFWNGWTRVLASTSNIMDRDHTFQDETGHFMYVNGRLGNSELQLEPVTGEESVQFCSLRCHYFTKDETEDGGLFVNVNGIRKQLTGIPKVSAWFPGCVALVDTCGDEPGSLNITFEVAEAEAGIDDIMLSADRCPEMEEGSVSCEFWRGDSCGYYMDSSAWAFTSDGNLATSAQEPGAFLVSQHFELTTNSCVTIAVGGISNYTIHLMVLDSNGDTVASTSQLNVANSTRRQINLDVQPGTELHLYFDAFNTTDSYLGWNDLTVYFINVTDTPCEHSGLSCDEGDHQCGENCIPGYMMCDGVRQCEDGSDEKCECKWSTFNCTLLDECIHPSLQCNRFNDCTDGSDEAGCGPSVNCSFSLSNWDCGYQLYNARKADALEMSSDLAFISSPEVSIVTESCFVIELGFCTPSNIRVLADDGEQYTVLYLGSTAFGDRKISVDIDIGHYNGLVTETQSETPFDDHLVTIADISLFDKPCQGQPPAYENITTRWTENSSVSTTTDRTATTRTTRTTIRPDTQTTYRSTSATRIWAATTTDRTQNSTSKTTTTPVPLPDDFPVVQVEEPDVVMFGASVNLTCKVTYDTKYELIMYWRLGKNLTISREDDIMVGDEAQSKYSVKKSQENGGMTYRLTVDDVTEADTTDHFYCVADVVGYRPQVWPTDGTMIRTEDDGCLAAGGTGIEELCTVTEYNRITLPGVYGVQTLKQAGQAVSYFQGGFDELRSYISSLQNRQCFDRLLETACEFLASHCEAGKAVKPLCREHCQEIAGVCMNDDSDVVTDYKAYIDHYCKYLPSVADQPDCTERWLECGVNVTLGSETTPMYVRLRSENYPHGSPSSSHCNYIIYASPHHTLNVTALDIMLADECSTSYLKVNGKKLCSSNVSEIEQLASEEVFNITLITDTSEQKTGFLLSVTQVRPTNMCDIVEINNINYIPYDGHSTNDESCSEWLFYSNKQGYNVGLNFTTIDGCLEILDKDLNSIQEICNLQTEPQLDGLDVVRIISTSGFKLYYSLLLYSPPAVYDFTIESIELREGASENEGKVYITRSDGISGYMCGYMNNGAADVICREAGFGSPALSSMKYIPSSSYDNDKTKLLYDLSCNGDEESLVQCYEQEWEDTCTGSCLCFSYTRLRGVSCPLKSVSCYMNTTSVCSYEYDKSIVLQSYTLRFGDGLYLTSSEGHVTNISSPSFTFFEGDSVSFEYSLDGNPGDSLGLYLRKIDETEEMSIWEKAEYTIDDRFGACVQLPNEFANTDVQLVFELSMLPSTSGNSHVIGLHSVTLNSESCPEAFPRGVCSFHNVEVCDLIFSKVCFDDSTGKTVWQIENNALVGDSTSTLPNKEYPLTFSIASTTGSYFHFKYSQTGAGVNGNDLKLMVRFESETDGSKTILTDNVHTSELVSMCSKLPVTVDENVRISFILTKLNSEGRIFLDDIAINNEYCPHPISCDFENADYCSYIMPPTSDFYWTRSYLQGDHTSGGHGNGYVLQAVQPFYTNVGQTTTPSYTNLGQQAVLKTPLANISGDIQYKCLSFFYKTYYSTDSHYKLEVEVLYLDTNETVTTEVDAFHPFTWQEENIVVDPSVSTKAQFSFVAKHISGYANMTFAIDDVALLQTDCVEGLQDLEQCDLNTPGLCGFEVNCTIDSGYIWQVHSGSTTTKNTGPSADADGSSNGYYLYLDSSLGGTGHESYLWFKVDTSDRTITQQYKFSYHMNGDGTAQLETFYRNAVTDTYSEKSSVQNMDTDVWFQSDCYQLPENFRGEIYFYGVRGDSVYSDIALDNIKIINGDCQNPSVSCEFTTSRCGYMLSDSNKWSLKGGYIANSGASQLNIPVYTLTEDSCIRFEFESDVNNILGLVVDTGTEPEEYIYNAYSEGTNVGQMMHLTTNKGMSFVVPDDNLVRIDRVTVATGSCNELACKLDEMACTWQCIPQTLACDRKWDCDDGRDEYGCGFSIPCEFTGSTDCGYATVPGSPTDWTVQDSHTFDFNDAEHTVSGGMLFTSFKDKPTLHSTSASSTWHSINETKCLRFSYLGTVPSLTVTASNWEQESRMQWTDTYASMTPPHWRPAQLTLQPGRVMVTFTASVIVTNYTLIPPDDAFVAISEVQLLSGACDIHDTPDCPKEASFQCDNGSLCYNEEVKCDRKQYCYSGSDESPEACSSEFTVSCDFENSNLCGWTILPAPDTEWKVSKGYEHQIPPFDHTMKDKTGHFLHFVNWNNNHDSYERATITSPKQTFPKSGCVTFWYYLNSTATQPNALSAQILVSFTYTEPTKTEFLWYDYVDRPIDTWIQGGVSVEANRSVQMNVTGIQFETNFAYPGVVAFDDVMYSPGECQVTQECHKRSFECQDSRVCIPEDFICDGKDDCVDGSDEAFCDTRPDGTLSLAGGDGTYGQLRYFQEGSWRAVCTQPTEESNFYMTQWVCEELGFTGNFVSFEYQLRDTTTQAVDLECERGSCTPSDCYSYYSTKYVGIKCSHDACFSGEKRCEGTDICVPKGRFCDGLPDCPNNSDEKKCWCKEGESRCTRTSDECSDDTCETCEDRKMFECPNHQCIDKNKRCDGKKDCSDGFDEYRCVQVNDHQVLLNNQSNLLTVCYNGIGRSEADMLCSLSGKGLVANGGIGHGYEQIDDGIELRETEGVESLLPGLRVFLTTSCYPLILRCELPECGTTAYMDSVISPLIAHGNKAVPGEWPYQGLLRKYGNAHCGCSLAGGRWALTAAHCVENSWSSTAFTVVFGSTNSGIDGPYGQEISVIAYHMHPSYNEIDATEGYDLALLELAYAPIIDNYTRPVCIGTEESWQEILALGDQAECFITGFGATELFQATGENPTKDLAETKVGIVDRDKCEELYDDLGAAVSPDGICLENREPYPPACKGDSGGPFVCKNSKGRWEQFGVASYGSSNCNAFVPTVYFSLTTQLEWIESMTGMNFATDYGDTP